MIGNDLEVGKWLMQKAVCMIYSWELDSVWAGLRVERDTIGKQEWGVRKTTFLPLNLVLRELWEKKQPVATLWVS